jgi:hypothetical protein
VPLAACHVACPELVGRLCVIAKRSAPRCRRRGRGRGTAEIRSRHPAGHQFRPIEAHGGGLRRLDPGMDGRAFRRPRRRSRHPSAGCRWNIAFQQSGILDFILGCRPRSVQLLQPRAREDVRAAVDRARPGKPQETGLGDRPPAARGRGTADDLQLPAGTCGHGRCTGSRSWSTACSMAGASRMPGSANSS